MRILVTGGMGFIGSSIVATLNSMGFHDITICDHLVSSQKWKNLIGCKFEELVDIPQLASFIKEKRFDVIFHMGARSDTREQDLGLLHKLNYQSSQMLFHYAADNRCRFIYASSAATYGNGEVGWSDAISPENLMPQNPYAYFKNQFDYWASIQRDKPAQCLGLKFFNVFGPNEYHKGRMASVMYHFYHQMMHEGKISLFQSYRSDIAHGHQKRDFIYIKDVMRIIRSLMDDSCLPMQGILNVGTGTARTYLDVASILCKTLGVNESIEFTEMPSDFISAYQYFSQSESSRIHSLIPDFSTLEDSIQDYVTYLDNCQRLDGV